MRRIDLTQEGFKVKVSKGKKRLSLTTKIIREIKGSVLLQLTVLLGIWTIIFIPSDKHRYLGLLCGAVSVYSFLCYIISSYSWQNVLSFYPNKQACTVFAKRWNYWIDVLSLPVGLLYTVLINYLIPMELILLLFIGVFLTFLGVSSSGELYRFLLPPDNYHSIWYLSSDVPENYHTVPEKEV